MEQRKLGAIEGEETDYRSCVWVCVRTIVNSYVDFRPLEEPAPSEYPPWQPATLSRFTQLSSSNCTVVEQTSIGAL